MERLAVDAFELDKQRVAKEAAERHLQKQRELDQKAQEERRRIADEAQNVADSSAEAETSNSVDDGNDARSAEAEPQSSDEAECSVDQTNSDAVVATSSGCATPLVPLQPTNPVTINGILQPLPAGRFHFLIL